MDLIRNAAMAVGILFCVGLIGAQFVGGGASDEAEVDAAEQEAAIERIQPTAKVTVAGAAAATEVPAAEAAAVEAAPAPTETPAAEPVAPAAPVAAPAATAADGETLYKQVCFACHDTGVAGSPKLGDSAAWAPRIATGIDALVANAISGKGAMPPKGGHMAFSDDTIRVIVEYMVSKGQ